MIRKTKENLSWFEFDLLQPYPHVRHGCFTRLGGISEGPFRSLNVGFHNDENPAHVYANRETIRKTLFDGSDGVLIDVDQAHTSNIAILSAAGRPQGPFDGLITPLARKALMIKHADCQSCLFFDPEHSIIANVHAGWRGSVLNIYAKTVALLIDQWHTRPDRLIACISPSLGPCHAVYENWEEIFPTQFGPFQTTPTHFNFWEISRQQLQECGLSLGNIEVAQLCTYDNPEDCFSYRRNVVTGRNATCIALM